MSIAGQLYELQLIDTDIDIRNETLAEVENQLGETEELVAAREAHAAARARVAALEDQAQRLEWDVESLQTKIAPMEAKLYAGTVRNPKELASMQQDVDSMKSRKRQLEDEALAVMAELEQAEADARSKKDALATVEGEWRESQDHLLAEQARLQQELARLKERRTAMLPRIDAAALRDYEILRPTRRGLAVALVERGMCQGCRISLPSTEIQRVRSSPGIVHCSSCGRILYLS